MNSADRAELINNYEEITSGLQELLTDVADPEIAALVRDSNTQLEEIAQQLNNDECIEITPSEEFQKKTVDEKDGSTIIIFPAPGRACSLAPYEVFYDRREWLACIVLAVIPPATSVDRQRYRTWILGYNVEEEVLFEGLRPFNQAAVLAEGLCGGAACHVIHPRRGVFVPAVVDRLTISDSVFVRMTNAEEGSSSTAPTAVEVPLSHARMGRIYKELRKREVLTDEQREKRRRELAERKRERTAQQREVRAAQVEKEADDWQSMMADVLGSGPKTARRRVG